MKVYYLIKAYCIFLNNHQKGNQVCTKLTKFMAEADKSLDRYTDQYNNFYTHTPPNFLMVELSFPVLGSIKQSPNSVTPPPSHTISFDLCLNL